LLRNAQRSPKLLRRRLTPSGRFDQRLSVASGVRSAWNIASMSPLEGRILREPDSISSLADTYLLHALDEFRSAGSAEMLYREQPPWYSGDSILGPIQQRADALFARLRHLRATVLFAALAAEGFANEFLASHLSGRALAAADRLPTTDKLIMGPTLAGLDPPIAYDREPGQSLTALFRARNDLAHPLVWKGTFPDIFESEDSPSEVRNPCCPCAGLASSAPG
jgi:hypothetical protein